MRAGMALAGRGKRSWVALLPRLVDDMQSLTIEGEDSCQWWAMGVVSRRAVIVAHREVAAVSAVGIGARAGCDMRSERGQRRRRTCRSLRGASRRSHPRAEPRVRRDLFLRLRYGRGGGRRGQPVPRVRRLRKDRSALRSLRTRRTIVMVPKAQHRSRIPGQRPGRWLRQSEPLIDGGTVWARCSCCRVNCSRPPS